LKAGQVRSTPVNGRGSGRGWEVVEKGLGRGWEGVGKGLGRGFGSGWGSGEGAQCTAAAKCSDSSAHVTRVPI